MSGGTYDGLLQFALQEGASEARVIEVAAIEVDPRVRFKCRLCEFYSRCLMCPPYLPDLDECRTLIERYRSAMLVQVRRPVTTKGETRADLEREIYQVAKYLHSLINKLEGKAFAEGFRYALGLIGGHCMLCGTCVADEGRGGICKFPLKARPSMEAMGIDVLTVAEKAGLPSRFEITKETVWTGMLLIE